MRVSDVFRSRFLRAADLNGRSPIVTIIRVTREDFDNGARLVLAFREGSKLLACNATNARTLAQLLGDETEQWPGRQIRLTVRDVDYKGAAVPAVRVAAADGPTAPSTPPAADPFGGLSAADF